MTRAVLSLGSNLGDRLAHLQSAVDGLGTAVRAVSPVFQTAPWGPVAQDDYLNAIVLVDDVDVDAEQWLRRGQLLEERAGRTRTVRFGPRTLDVDVITVDGVCSDDPRLTLPHPRAHERAFVLVPWLAVSPEAQLPRQLSRAADGAVNEAAGGRADLVADRGGNRVAGASRDREDARGDDPRTDREDHGGADAGTDRVADREDLGGADPRTDRVADRQDHGGADPRTDRVADREDLGGADPGTDRGDLGGADPGTDRVADLVAALPAEETAGVRRRDDLTLRLPTAPTVPVPPRGMGSGQ